MNEALTKENGMNNNNCENCCWFDFRHTGEDGESVIDGECRIHPPIAGPSGGEWPIVKADDWCGAYQETK